jgi:hypothetical protein
MCHLTFLSGLQESLREQFREGTCAPPREADKSAF